MSRFLLVVTLAAAVLAGGRAGAPRVGVRWARSWADAVEEARALNLPIVVHRHGFYWGPCWSLHRSVLDNKAYIEFSRRNCVEVMAMQDQEQALREKPKRAETYRTRDPYGDEIECYVKFPGVTVEEMKALFNSDALQYMEGPLMPYTAVVDPHTLETLGGIKRGEPTTVKTLTALVAKCRRKLTDQHGKGIDRKVWDRVNEAGIKIDIALGKKEHGDALALLLALQKDLPRPPEGLETRIAAARASVFEDIAAHFARIESGQARKDKRELEKLARALKGTSLEERARRLLE